MTILTRFAAKGCCGKRLVMSKHCYSIRRAHSFVQSEKELQRGEGPVARKGRRREAESLSENCQTGSSLARPVEMASTDIELGHFSSWRKFNPRANLRRLPPYYRRAHLLLKHGATADLWPVTAEPAVAQGE